MDRNNPMVMRGSNLRHVVTVLILVMTVLSLTGCSSNGTPANDVQEVDLVGEWSMDGDAFAVLDIESDGELTIRAFPSINSCAPSDGRTVSDRSDGTGTWRLSGSGDTIIISSFHPCFRKIMVGWLTYDGADDLQILFYEPDVDQDSLPDPKWVLRKISER